MKMILETVSTIPTKESRYILSGPSGSGKTTLLNQRYHTMVNDFKIRSESILILLLNRSQSLEWRDKTSLFESGAIFRTSFYGFIQNEVNTYYPYILEKCRDIKKRESRPIFLTFESAQFLVSKVIEHRRKSMGIFAGLTSLHDRIAIDMVANVVKAAGSDIPYDEIGKRLYQTLEKKNELKQKLFEDCDCVIEDYRQKCLELGVFDFGMTVDFYNRYLMKDEFYRNSLHKRIRHLIVDNLEEAVPAAIDFIREIEPSLDSCMMAFNPEGGYGEIFGSNFSYSKELLTQKFKTVQTGTSHTASRFMYEFSDMLFDAIGESKKNKIKPSPQIERTPAFELRSDMLEAVGSKLVDLILNQKYKPSDIVVISTFADPVTEAVIEKAISPHGVSLKNLARKSRIIDHPFLKALITLAELCHPQFNHLPGRDEVKELLRMLLTIDPVRSSLLAFEILSQRPFAKFPDIEFPGLVERVGYYNLKKYQYIRDWLEEYKEGEPLPIHEFLQKVFLEVLISQYISEEDIQKARNLIDSAANFYHIVSRFGRNASRDFVEMVKKGVKAAESIFELEEKLKGNQVLMSTPVAYLASSQSHKIMILLGITSKNWTPRSIKELTNVHVLTKTWNPEEVYTEEVEEERQKQYLAIVMRNLLKHCGDKLLTFESELSSAGYENDGILSTYIDDLLEQ